MKRTLSFLFALLWLVPDVPVPAVGAAARQADRFTVGVLRRDGLVIPFAAYDGRRWAAPWPADYSTQDLPITLADVPGRWWGRPGPPASLTLWSGGEKAGPVALEKPAPLRIMCSTRMALRTDYRSKGPLPAPFVQPHPKDGLVVSGEHTVRPIMSVPASSPEWNAGPVVVREEFNRVEDAAASSFTSWRHPYSRDQRWQTPIVVEAIYRVPMDKEGWAAYYVEAVREYKPGPADGGCGLVSFVSGWIRVGPAGAPRFDLSARVTYCDRRKAAFMLPLGIIRADNRTFWIYQISGYDREWYVVAHPTPERIELHVDYHAGDCPE